MTLTVSRKLEPAKLSLDLQNLTTIPGQVEWCQETAFTFDAFLMLDALIEHHFGKGKVMELVFDY